MSLEERNRNLEIQRNINDTLIKAVESLDERIRKLEKVATELEKIIESLID